VVVNPVHRASFIAAVALKTAMGITRLSAYAFPAMTLEQASRIPGYNSKVWGLQVAGSWRERNQKG
jgi:hypothetical protein